MLHVALLAGVAVASSRDAEVLTRPSLLVYLGLMAVWCAVEARSHAPRPCVRAGWLPAAIGAALVGCSITAVAEFAWRTEAASGAEALRVIVGATMMVIGIALRISAIRGLGRFFLDGLTLLDDHRRVNTGVYARMRHPSELGTLLLAAGTVTTLGSQSAGLLALLTLMPLVLVRIHLENRLMAGVV